MEYVKGITSDHDLIALAKQMNVKLDGVILLDEVKSTKGSYIVLLGGDNGVPGHWVAIHNGQYFDSTGVGPPTKLGDLPYNQIQYQSPYEEFCGIFCMLWLYSKQKNNLELMKGFSNLDVDIL